MDGCLLDCFLKSLCLGEQVAVKSSVFNKQFIIIQQTIKDAKFIEVHVCYSQQLAIPCFLCLRIKLFRRRFLLLDEIGIDHLYRDSLKRIAVHAADCNDIMALVIIDLYPLPFKCWITP
jgi:hypothetical protein